MKFPRGTEGKNLTLPGLFCTGFVSAGASPLPVWVLLAVCLAGTEGKRCWGLGTGGQEEKQHQHCYFPVLGVPCLQTHIEVDARTQQGWEHAPVLWSAAGGYRNRCVHPPTPRFHRQAAPVLAVVFNLPSWAFPGAGDRKVCGTSQPPLLLFPCGAVLPCSSSLLWIPLLLSL